MANDDKHDDLTTSICEAALSSFSASDDSLAGMIEQYAITVRDFMMLSLLCDQESFDLDQLERAVGLNRDELERSLTRLTNAGLIKHNGVAAKVPEIRTTVSGRVLARRILDGIG